MTSRQGQLLVLAKTTPEVDVNVAEVGKVGRCYQRPQGWKTAARRLLSVDVRLLFLSASFPVAMSRRCRVNVRLIAS